jgi:hypothetical protein
MTVKNHPKLDGRSHEIAELFFADGVGLARRMEVENAVGGIVGVDDTTELETTS